MKKLSTDNISGLIGQPLKKGSINHIFDAIKEQAVATFKGQHNNYDGAKVNVLFGCNNTGTGGVFDISEGAVIWNEELFIVDATTFTPVDTAVAVITTTYVSALGYDPTLMTDGINKNVHAIRKIQIIDGSTASDGYVADYADFNFGDFRALLEENDYTATITASSPSYTTIHTEVLQKTGKVLFLFDMKVTPASGGGATTYIVTFDITKNGVSKLTKILSVVNDGGARDFTMVKVLNVDAGDTIVIRANNSISASVAIDGRLILQGSGVH